jgi:16S rRNA (guanine(966)-N(2))-methyltransferase RsmD
MKPRAGLGGKPSRPSRTAASAPQQVRIIGGLWKRTPLAVADVPGLRPTPDRVRETLFNWLGQQLIGLRCLDLFAGSGALGLEAASRGASRVVLVEADRRAARQIAQACARLRAEQVTLLEADAFAALERLSRAGERFDLVFLDPPFGQGLTEQVSAPLLPLLEPAARLYVEAEAPLARLPEGFVLERSAQAGQVHYHLLARCDRPARGGEDGERGSEEQN